MLNNILNSLTKEQRMALHIRGIPSSLTSAWRLGKRRPTYAQCVSLCEVTGCDLPRLLTEIALAEARPEQQQMFAHLLDN